MEFCVICFTTQNYILNEQNKQKTKRSEKYLSIILNKN